MACLDEILVKGDIVRFMVGVCQALDKSFGEAIYYMILFVGRVHQSSTHIITIVVCLHVTSKPLILDSLHNLKGGDVKLSLYCNTHSFDNLVGLDSYHVGFLRLTSTPWSANITCLLAMWHALVSAININSMVGKHVYWQCDMH